MLKGLRTGIKFFTIGLVAGLVVAPRKGSETFKLLVGRGKELAAENLSITERSNKDNKGSEE